MTGVTHRPRVRKVATSEYSRGWLRWEAVCPCGWNHLFFDWRLAYGVARTHAASMDPNADRPVAITADFSRVQFGLQAAAPSWGWGGNDG